MKTLGSLFLLLIVLAVSGCAIGLKAGVGSSGGVFLVPALKWTRIPEAPEYTVEAPIPLRAGIILDDSTAYSASGLDVFIEWEEMRLFDSLVYPYKEGDPVDAVIRITTAGKMEEEGMLSRDLVDMLTLFTLGLSRPIVGRSATFTHDALAVIRQSSDEIGRYSVEVSSTVRWEAGTGAMGLNRHPLFTPSFEDQRRVNSRASGYELQGKRLAFELAKKIRADRQNLLSKLGKSQEETTAP